MQCLFLERLGLTLSVLTLWRPLSRVRDSTSQAVLGRCHVYVILFLGSLHRHPHNLESFSFVFNYQSYQSVNTIGYDCFCKEIYFVAYFQTTLWLLLFFKYDQFRGFLFFLDYRFSWGNISTLELPKVSIRLVLNFFLKLLNYQGCLCLQYSWIIKICN